MYTLKINIYDATVNPFNLLFHPGHLYYTVENTETGEVSGYGFNTSESTVGTIFPSFGTGTIEVDNYLSYPNGPDYTSKPIDLSKSEYDAFVSFGGGSESGSGFDYENYNLYTNSCVDFVWAALNYAGVDYSGYEGSLIPSFNESILSSSEDLYELVNFIGSKSESPISREVGELLFKSESFSEEPLEIALTLKAKLASLFSVAEDNLYSDSISLSFNILKTSMISEHQHEDSKEGYAYRYALENLNSFAVVDTYPDHDLYDAHNTNGNLNAENFTAEYLSDRANMLFYKNIAYTNNKEHYVNNTSYSGNVEYIDVKTGFTATFSATGDSTPVKKIIFGTLGDETINGGEGDDTIYGRVGIDTIDGKEGDDTVYGGRGNDLLMGSSGYDILKGGEGDDKLYGNRLNDRTDPGGEFEGGKGNDELFGTDGADIYTFNSGDGVDVINEVQGSLVDVLEFKGIQSEDIRISNDNDQIIFSHINGQDTVTISGVTESSQFIVKFDGVTTWLTQDLFTESSNIFMGSGLNETISSNTNGTGSESDFIYGLTGHDSLYGNNGVDFIYGGHGNDKVYGGAGYDYLNGGSGNDYLYGNKVHSTYYYDNSGNEFIGGIDNDFLYGNRYADKYIFSAGDGIDTIYEWYYSTNVSSAVDEIDFLDVASTSVDVSRNGNHLTLTNINGTDKITINNWYVGDNYRVEEVNFSDGVSLSKSEVTELGLYLHGDYTDDTLTGLSNYENKLFGHAGTDTLNGGSSDDILIGGDGVDTLYGNAGNDTLMGGEGNIILGPTNTVESTANDTAGNIFKGGLDNDEIFGSLYSDIYLFTKGDGQDVISDHGEVLGALDVLDFSGVTKTDLWFERVGDNLEISILSNDDKVTIDSWYLSEGNQLDSIRLNGGSYGSLDNNEVEILVEAMAPYTPPSAGETMTSLGLTGVIDTVNEVY